MIPHSTSNQKDGSHCPAVKSTTPPTTHTRTEQPHHQKSERTLRYCATGRNPIAVPGVGDGTQEATIVPITAPAMKPTAQPKSSLTKTPTIVKVRIETPTSVIPEKCVPETCRLRTKATSCSCKSVTTVLRKKATRHTVTPPAYPGVTGNSFAQRCADGRRRAFHPGWL